jgi:diguanylate cyclase (GGDEF)-like protein
MPRELDPADRILRPLSELLGKPLRIVGEPVNGEETAIRVSRGTVLTVEGDLTTDERRAISEILDVMRENEVSEAHLGQLEKRVTQLARENLELSVRNSILAEASARDPLTGLYNRWYVLDKMEAEINRTLRHGSAMALLMLDIDHFKNVNDTYGHPAGDHVLQVVARLLKESCRVYDVPGRYGGEEFCLLLPETSMLSTPNVAQRIQQRLATTDMELTDTSVVVTASIGIAGIDAASPDAVLSPAALIDRADRALYSAKNTGRNRVAIWDAQLRGARPLGTEH